jgi:hypothetical protein
MTPRPSKGQHNQQNDALKIGELPELHIVDVEDVILHEDPDMERVARLVERFSADGVLKNPPVVARADGDTKRIMLDGANRITALKKLDISHVLVQEVGLFDEGLDIKCWHHAVEYLTGEELLSHADSIDGLEIERGGETELLNPRQMCRLRFPDGGTAVLKGSPDLLERVEQLQSFTHLYHRLDYLDRVSYTNMEHLRANYSNLTALISFNLFSKDDLITLTEAGVTTPSGITRVLLPKRALRFNLQLEVLRSSLLLEDKEEWLRENIRTKVADKEIRFYREPTFFFDE